jgi:hypothetical protein
MKENEFKNKVYKAIIGETERREYNGTYQGNGHHLAQRLTELVDVEFKDTVTTGRREQGARREQTRKAFDEIAGDLIDMDAYMKNIDLHIQWLGAALPTESVVIPEFLAAMNTLNRISARLAAVGIISSTE